MTRGTDVSEHWPVVKLGEVADLCLGKMLDANKNKGRLLPYLRNPNVRWFDIDTTDLRLMPFEEHEDERYGLRAGDVVICEGGEAGRAAIWDGRIPHLKFQKAIHRVRPSNDLDGRYLVHRLMADYHSGRLADYYTGATIKHLTGQDLARYRFRLPPLPEQRRIAEILDKADALRAKRRAALVQLDSLTQSVFLDMFGDPVKNPKSWAKKRIGEVATVITGNTPPRKNEAYYGDDVEWIKSDNINTPDYYLTAAEERLSHLGRQAARVVPAGAILVTCIAGSRECIGNAAMANREVAFNQQINAVVPLEGNAHFLYAHFRAGKRIIQAASTDAMKGMVSKSRFERVLVIWPPLRLQDKFAQRVLAVSAARERQKAFLAEADALFASLQHRAFRGEL